MNRGIYPILSGALAHERRMQVFANNMANINTAGFKEDEQSFQALFPRTQMGLPPAGHTASLALHIGARPFGPAERAFAAPHTVKTTFEPGRVRLTGNPLDAVLIRVARDLRDSSRLVLCVSSAVNRVDKLEAMVLKLSARSTKAWYRSVATVMLLLALCCCSIISATCLRYSSCHTRIFSTA